MARSFASVLVLGLFVLLLMAAPARAECLAAAPEADSVTGCITVRDDVTEWDFAVNNGVEGDAECVYAKVVIDRDNEPPVEIPSFIGACGALTPANFQGRASYAGTRGARVLLCKNDPNACEEIHYEPER